MSEYNIYIQKQPKSDSSEFIPLPTTGGSIKLILADVENKIKGQI